MAAVPGAADAIRRAGHQPRRTIRFVLFTGEEQGLLGSRAYVRQYRQEMRHHLAAIIMDSGQGPVTGLSLGRDDVVASIRPFAATLASFGARRVVFEAKAADDVLTEVRERLRALLRL